MTEEPLLRVGDEERNGCVEVLVEHHIQGRLTLEEFEQRHQAAAQAKTFADLAVLVADLPGASLASVPARPTASSAGAGWWDLEPRERARQMAVWAAPPATLVTGAVLSAAFVSPQDDVSQFACALATGILGYATHWVPSHWRPQWWR
jgi:hypothetical protein